MTFIEGIGEVGFEPTSLQRPRLAGTA